MDNDQNGQPESLAATIARVMERMREEEVQRALEAEGVRERLAVLAKRDVETWLTHMEANVQGAPRDHRVRDLVSNAIGYHARNLVQTPEMVARITDELIKAVGAIRWNYGPKDYTDGSVNLSEHVGKVAEDSLNAAVGQLRAQLEKIRYGR